MEGNSINMAPGKQAPPISRLNKARNTAAYQLTRPAVWLLVRTPVTPNAITWFGFALFVIAATLVVTENLLAAGLMVLFAGLFDMLDGALARRTNRVTRFGAILDSTLDRATEALLLLGILILFAREQSMVGMVLTGIALPGSLMVSYIRARAEAAGLECKVGLGTRGERVIILALGLLLNRVNYALIAALGIITLLSLFTIGQRMIFVWQQTKND